MDALVIFMVIILVASILQTSTGFGFSIMATPFLLYLFRPQEAIQINIILSLIISLALMWKIRSEVDFQLFKRFTLGSLFGIPLGIVIFLIMNLSIFKLSVSCLLLFLTLLLIVKFKIKATPFRDYIIGGLSGVLTTSIGMPGPPLLLYFTGTATKKEKLRATTLAFYLFIYFVSLLTQITFAGTSKLIWESSLFVIPVVILGLLLGNYLFTLFTEKIFRITTYILLCSSGLYLLLDSIIDLF